MTDDIGKIDMLQKDFYEALFYFTNNALSELWALIDFGVQWYANRKHVFVLSSGHVTKHGVWVHKNRFWIKISLFTR